MTDTDIRTHIREIFRPTGLTLSPETMDRVVAHIKKTGYTTKTTPIPDAFDEEHPE